MRDPESGCRRRLRSNASWRLLRQRSPHHKPAAEMLSSAPTRRKEAMKIQGQFLIRCLAAAALAGALSTAALPCAAQAHPAKPLLVLLPLQAGGACYALYSVTAA